jgi:hypothetical protein
VGVAPVDEEGDSQRARKGRCGVGHEETRMEGRVPRRQARPAPTLDLTNAD